MELHLDNKVALVTGASSGIGRACAASLTRSGAHVVVSDLESASEQGQNVVEHLRSMGGEATFIPCDVSDESDIKDLVRQTLDTYGRLDAAVNNAGVSGKSAPTHEYGAEDWDHVMAVNLRGVFLCMKHEILAMKDYRDDGTRGGSIVNVASILGHVGFLNAGAYTASKHGVIGLTKAAAMEYGEIPIRVNTVDPAFIITPMLEQAGLLSDPDKRHMLEQLHAMKRMGRPAEVASIVSWLCSEKASFVTGSSYLVDGGYTAH